jgi:hypothetical protein
MVNDSRLWWGRHSQHLTYDSDILIGDKMFEKYELLFMDLCITLSSTIWLREI